MKKVVLYIAMSQDGYIADKEGKVDWLKGQNAKEENIDTYSSFIKEVDTVIMGRNTYKQIITELSPNQWIYHDLTTYVITHRKLPPTENVKSNTLQSKGGMRNVPFIPDLECLPNTFPKMPNI